jgi:hypothetical protein
MATILEPQRKVYPKCAESTKRSRITGLYGKSLMMLREYLGLPAAISVLSAAFIFLRVGAYLKEHLGTYYILYSFNY